MKRYSIVLVYLLMLGACKKALDLHPQDKLTPNEAFATDQNLQLYVNSFYNNGIPAANALFTRDQMSDITAQSIVNTYINGSSFTSQTAGVVPVAGLWSWGELRNINYFLENYQQANTTEARKDHFAGMAKFFRAWFYFELVKMYGNVPWYSKPISLTDEDQLYKTQDPRTLVMDSVLADINFACTYIDDKKDGTSSMITKWVALALKSRICLFEGTYRKYHTELNLINTAAAWLQEALNAADLVMKSGNYSLSADYRALFISQNPVASEVILANVFNDAMKRWHDANWTFTGASYGGNISFVKRFINTFLRIDGTRFTDTPNFDEIEFQHEVKNRDKRLAASIRMAPYVRSDASAAPPDFGQTFTGYQIKKWTMDDKSLDGKAQNYNSIPILRYAEVLLNYAEAKAELGTFTITDWDNTIGLLRKRAGITTATMPVTLDAYMKTNFFADVNDIAIMEIRRERAIELAMEGFRFDDLKRWKQGKLLEKEFNGIYVPALGQLLDLNEDTKPDVSFVTAIPTNKVPGVVYFLIDNTNTKLSQGTKGRIIWRANIAKQWQDYKYYAPIPYSQIVLNPNLVQNPEWK
jgi:starch-binding outer membrane protein, SusD/RagB family